MLERFQKSDERLAFAGSHCSEGFPGGLALVPEDGLGQGSGATIVQIGLTAADVCSEADAPERCGAPLGTGGGVFA
jgi:hypothetical protein